MTVKTHSIDVASSIMVNGVEKLNASGDVTTNLVRGANNGTGVVVGHAPTGSMTGSTLQLVSLTTGERDNLVGANGMMIWNETTSEIQSYNAGWAAVGGGGGGESLAATLAIGNTTGGADLLVTGGDAIDAATAVPLTIGDTNATAVNIAGGTSTATVALGNAAAGAITLDSAAGVSIDAAAASNFTVTGSGLDLTLEAAGGGAGQQVIVNSAGTGTAAIRLNASAGGLDIDGTRCDISTSGAFTNAIRVNAVGGGIDMDADFAISIQSDQSGGGAVDIGAPTGSVTFSAGTGTSVATIASSGTGSNAVDVNAPSGGMTIDVATGFSIDATNASSSNLTCTNTTASTNSTLTIACNNTGATAGDATIDIDANSTNGIALVDIGGTNADSVSIGRTAGNIGFYGATPVAKAATYTPTNVVADRAYDADATTLDEVADVLGTLISDLQAVGLIG